MVVTAARAPQGSRGRAGPTAGFLEEVGSEPGLMDRPTLAGKEHTVQEGGGVCGGCVSVCWGSVPSPRLRGSNGADSFSHCSEA